MQRAVSPQLVSRAAATRKMKENGIQEGSRQEETAGQKKSK
jgi:hypothetical protein